MGNTIEVHAKATMILYGAFKRRGRWDGDINERVCEAFVLVHEYREME